MGTLVLVEFLSIDGVMQGLGSPQEDTEGGFRHGGWGAPYAAAIHQDVGPGLSRTAGYLFGRRTYEKMAAYWPHQPDSNPIAAHMNATPKYVASRTLTSVAWPGTRILRAEVPATVRDLKSRLEGDLVVLGSGVLARELMAEGVVDELRLFLHPLLLGTGKRLFGTLPQPRQLTLTALDRTDLGSVVLTYRIGPVGTLS